MKKYRFGIDIGTASFGLVAVAIENKDIDTPDNPISIDHLDTVIYNEPIDPKTFALFNQKRREKRLARRNLNRYKDRQKQIIYLYKLLNKETSSLNNVKSTDIFKLRALSISQKIELNELFRVLLHLAKNRGYKGDIKDGSVSGNIQSTTEALKIFNVKTLGEYFYEKQKEHFKSGAKIRDTSVGNNQESKTKKEADAPTSGVYIKRESIEKEFDLIIQEQSKHHSILEQNYESLGGKKSYFNENMHEKITTFADALKICIFYQRPIKWDKDTIKNCPYSLKDEKVVSKASFIYQQYRIEKKLTDLTYKDNGKKVHLNNNQKQILRDALNNNTSLSFEKIYELLKLDRSTNKFSEDRTELASDKSIAGNKTKIYIEKHFANNEYWVNLTNEEQELAINFWSYLSSKDELYQDKNIILHNIGGNSETSQKIYNFFNNIKDSDALCILSAKSTELDSGRAEYSAYVLQHLINGFKQDENGEEQKLIEEYTKNGLFKKPNEIIPGKLTNLNNFGITNPIVKRSLTQLQNAIMYAISKLNIGFNDEDIKNNKVNILDSITIELTREMKTPPSKRSELENENTKQKRLKDKFAKELIEKNQASNAKNIVKKQLLEEQGGICAYSGRIINNQDFNNCEVDHIIPTTKGGSNAMYNKVLCYADINKGKTNLTPFQAKDKNIGIKWDVVQDLAKKYKKNKDLKKKAELLLFEQDPTLAEDALERQFSETSYIGKFLSEWLKPLVAKADDFANENEKKAQANYIIKSRILVSRGMLTAFLRKHWDIDSKDGLSSLLQEIRMQENKPLINKNKTLLNPFIQQEYRNLQNKHQQIWMDVKTRKNSHPADEYKAIQSQTYADMSKEKADFFAYYKIQGINDISFNKRCDNRHHLIDATIIALTTRSLLQKASDYYKNKASLKGFEESDKISAHPPITKLKDVLKSKLINFVIWNKPDRHLSKSFVKEGVYSLAGGKIRPAGKTDCKQSRESFINNVKSGKILPKEDSLCLIHKVPLDNLLDKTFEGTLKNLKDKERIVGNEIRDAIVEQFEARYNILTEQNKEKDPLLKAKEENIIREALLGKKNTLIENKFQDGIYFPQHNKKNKVNAVKVYHRINGRVRYNHSNHLYKINNNAVQINDGYACAIINFNTNTFEFLSPIEANNVKKTLQNNANSSLLYQGDTIYYKPSKQFYVVQQFNEAGGILTLLSTESFSYGVMKDTINTNILNLLKTNTLTNEEKEYFENLSNTNNKIPFFKAFTKKDVANITIIKTKQDIANIKKELKAIT